MAIGLLVIAAGVSLLRGGRYVHEEQDAGGDAGECREGRRWSAPGAPDLWRPGPYGRPAPLRRRPSATHEAAI